MLKKAKSDAPKPEKAKGDKSKSGQQQYFWTAYLNKRKAKKVNVRESSIPKTPMSREDRIKLIICAVIVLLIPMVIFAIVSYNSAHPKPIEKPDPNK
jgi:hypothetical protein